MYNDRRANDLRQMIFGLVTIASACITLLVLRLRRLGCVLLLPSRDECAGLDFLGAWECRLAIIKSRSSKNLGEKRVEVAKYADFIEFKVQRSNGPAGRGHPTD